MTAQELTRLKIVEAVKSGHMRQVEGAKRLSLSTRQLRRLLRKYEKKGPKGLISGHRGKASNHQVPQDIKVSAEALIREHYADFGPTLAAEYLQASHNLKLSVETVRQLMIKAELWRPKRQRKPRVYQQRQRRERFGELIQADGSHHDWFEGRADKCCLLVLIDDATGKLVGLLFFDTETMQGYFQVVHDYIQQYGLPMAFYTDKHSIFRVNIKDAKTGTGFTQFGRAMEELGIELIHAHSPQAKGRVEKANRTLQDRLVKAMRLRNICSQEEGNAYLPVFIEEYNQKFAKPPFSEANAHCQIDTNDGALVHILSEHSERTLSNNLECSYNNVTYQIQAQGYKYRLQRKSVIISENYRGEIAIFYQGRQLDYKIFDKGNQPQAIHDDKTLNHAVDKVAKRPRQQYKPAPDHPWRQYKNKPKQNQTAMT